RLTAAGSPVKALAAHPGYAATNLQAHTESIQDTIMALGNRIMAQSAEMGALPTLYAATMDLPGATYIGPGGFLQQRGHPKLVTSNSASHNKETAQTLWDLSEHLTDVTYKLTS